MARAVQLAVRQNDLNTAAQTLAQLCIYPSDQEWPLQAAVESMIAANWTTEAQTILFDAFPQPDAHPKVGYHWVYCCEKLKQRKFCQKQLQKFHPDHPVQRQALITYIRLLSYRDSSVYLMQFIRMNRKVLRANSETWGIVGYALSRQKEHKQNLKWLSDWQRRNDAKPWMLLNLVTSLQALKKGSQAVVVSQHALTLASTNGASIHQLWLAYAASKDENATQARSFLEKIDSTRLEQEYQFLYFITEANLDIALKKLPSYQCFKQAQLHIQQAITAYPQFRSCVSWQHILSSSVWRIAKKRRNISSYIWAIRLLVMKDLLWSIFYVASTIILIIFKSMQP